MKAKINFRDELMEREFIELTDYMTPEPQGYDARQQRIMYEIYNFFTKENIENHGCSSCLIKIKRFLLALRQTHRTLNNR